MFYFHPFSTTTYTKVPAKLSTLKLELRETKPTLVGYFGQKSYKLLNQTTNAVLNARNIIFKEGLTNYTKRTE